MAKEECRQFRDSCRICEHGLRSCAAEVAHCSAEAALRSADSQLQVVCLYESSLREEVGQLKSDKTCRDDQCD